MKLISMICPNCGADLELNPDKKTAFCPYCGTKVFLSDEASPDASGADAGSARSRQKEDRDRFTDAAAADRVSDAIRLKELEFEHEREMFYLQQQEKEKKNWRFLVLLYVGALIISGIRDPELNIFTYILVFGGIALVLLRPRRKLPADAYTSSSSKNRGLAFVLCLFLGTFGGHYFYVGRPVMGVVYLLTLGIGGIGWIIDLVRILLGFFRDGRGYYVK